MPGIPIMNGIIPGGGGPPGGKGNIPAPFGEPIPGKGPAGPAIPGWSGEYS
jgi:hypothetical protein